MAIFKRGEVWWIEFVVNGKRTRVSAGTPDPKQAQELHDQLRAKAWRATKLGEKEPHTWEEAALRWLREKEGKKDYDGDCAKIEFFNPYFKGKLLTDITSDLIYEVVEKHKAGAAGSTRNRYYALARSIMRRAAMKWRWIEANDVPFVNQHKESNGSKRFLEPEELSRLLKELPDHLRDIAAVAVATGLRMSNVTGMQWKWLNLAARTVTIPGEFTKNSEPLTLPLNELAAGVIERRVGTHPEFVFTFRGKPVTCVSNTAWYAALKRAGLDGVRFHDLRHTFASYLAQSGASDRELQELGGWKTQAMVRRYSHLRAAHLAPAVGLIDRVLSADRLLAVEA